MRDRFLRQSPNLGATRHPVPRRIHSVEDVLLCGFAGERQKILGRRTGSHRAVADVEALCLVHRPTAAGDRDKKFAQRRVDAADVDLYDARSFTGGHGGSRAGHADIVDNPPGLPRGQFAELLGKRARVASELESLNGEDGGRGVMAVSGARLRREARHYDVGPEGADYAHDVSQDFLPIPDPQSLPVILRKPEVFRAGEVLSSSIQTPRSKQFLGAGHAQLFTELGPKQVLAAIAARERQIGRPVSTTARQIGDDPRIFVIRMRCDVQHAAHSGKAAHLLQNIGGGRILIGATEPGAADHQGCAEGQRSHSAGPFPGCAQPSGHEGMPGTSQHDEASLSGGYCHFALLAAAVLGGTRPFSRT